MIIVNFAHPLTPDHQAQIEALTSQPVHRVIEVNSQIDPQSALAPQVQRMVEQAGLTPAQWQSDALLINPPSLNYSAAFLMAQLHGRMGHFPACIRLRPVAGVTPPQYEVAEVLNLQAVRDDARQNR